MKDLDIGDVSKITGLSPATLRYYEKKELISPSGRNGIRRIYDPSVLQTLSLVMLGQKAGFSLDEMKNLTSPVGGTKIPSAILMEKADEIDHRVIELIALRDGLRHVAKCQAPTHTECPRFNKIMKVALARIGNSASTKLQKAKK